ncbi:MAG: hypothetical protein RQ757_10780 [Pseudomonadales bacterium]|nr:hypothetical protein [Pseudomonadales bacterium]
MNTQHHRRQMTSLIQREFWEHKFASFWVPIIILAISLLVWLRFNLGSASFLVDQLANLALLPAAEARAQATLLVAMPTLPFASSLLIVIPIYLLMCLYEDRKTGSYLFWYSMPVSNTKTVLSKLITAALLMPGISLLIYLALCLGIIFLCTLTLLLHGEPLTAIGILLASLSRWSVQLFLLMIYLAFWLLPLYGWLLLISAFARSVPVFWAIGLLLMLALAERVILSSSYFSTWLSSRGLPYSEIFNNYTNLFAAMPWYEMSYGLLLGSILLAGAIMMRRFPD